MTNRKENPLSRSQVDRVVKKMDKMVKAERFSSLQILFDEKRISNLCEFLLRDKQLSDLGVLSQSASKLLGAVARRTGDSSESINASNLSEIYGNVDKLLQIASAPDNDQMRADVADIMAKGLRQYQPIMLQHPWYLDLSRSAFKQQHAGRWLAIDAPNGIICSGLDSTEARDLAILKGSKDPALSFFGSGAELPVLFS